MATTFISKTQRIGASLYVLVPAVNVKEGKLSEGDNCSIKLEKIEPFKGGSDE